MKKMLLSACALIIGSAAFAQTPQIDAFFQKYEGKEGFTSVQVSETLFSWIASATDDTEEWQSVVDGIKGIRILVYENTDSTAQSGKFYNEFMSSVPLTGYQELMDVKAEGEKVKLYGQNITGSVLNNMLLVCDADGEFVMISIAGAIDISKISELGDMDIDGLEELKKLETPTEDK